MIEGPEPGARPDALSRERLSGLALEHRAELFREWLDSGGLPLPSRARLAEIDRQMVRSTSARALLAHGGRWIVRHRDRIGILGELPMPRAVAAIPRVPPARWLPRLPEGSIRFRIAIDCAAFPILVAGPGRADERLRLRGDAMRHRLRTLWQEGSIPAWMRPALPAVRDARTGGLLAAFPFDAEAVAAVGGVDAAADLWTEQEDPGHVCWQPPAEWLPWLAGARRGTSPGASI